MRSLNLDQLRSLVEVGRVGSFSTAARNLSLTQPAVSMHIRALEERFGVPLVERLGRRASPTEPGQQLIGHAGRIFDECERASLSLRRYGAGWTGRVRLGTTLTALTYQLPPVLKKLRADYPELDLQVSNMPTRDSVERVLGKELDLALVTLPIHEHQLTVTSLVSETLVAILPAETRDIPAMVTPAYAARMPLVLEHTRGAVYARVMEWLDAELPLARTPMNIGTVEAMKTAVASDLGMSIVPDVAVRHPVAGIVVRPIDPPVTCPLGLIEHRRKPNDRAVGIVRDALLTLSIPSG